MWPLVQIGLIAALVIAVIAYVEARVRKLPRRPISHYRPTDAEPLSRRRGEAGLWGAGASALPKWPFARTAPEPKPGKKT